MTELNLTQRIETTILSSLIHNEEYTRKVIPFVKPEYFQDGIEKVIFQTIERYTNKYKSTPNIETLVIDVQKVSLNEEQYKGALEYLAQTIFVPEADHQWLLDETERFCKDKAIYNAILDGIHIIDGLIFTKSFRFI